MKMLFKSGKIIDNNENSRKIWFDTVSNPELDKSFLNSIYDVVGMLGRYDLDFHSKVNDKEIFYVYDTNNNKEEIFNDIENIINGDYTSVLNKEDININSSINNESNETIFWDVENQTIIVIGRESLYCFANALETQRWKSWLQLFDKDLNFKNSIQHESLSKIYKKTEKILEKK